MSCLLSLAQRPADFADNLPASLGESEEEEELLQPVAVRSTTPDSTMREWLQEIGGDSEESESLSSDESVTSGIHEAPSEASPVEGDGQGSSARCGSPGMLPALPPKPAFASSLLGRLECISRHCVHVQRLGELLNRCRGLRSEVAVSPSLHCGQARCETQPLVAQAQQLAIGVLVSRWRRVQVEAEDLSRRLACSTPTCPARLASSLKRRTARSGSGSSIATRQCAVAGLQYVLEMIPVQSVPCLSSWCSRYWRVACREAACLERAVPVWWRLAALEERKAQDLLPDGKPVLAESLASIHAVTGCAERFWNEPLHVRCTRLVNALHSACPRPSCQGKSCSGQSLQGALLEVGQLVESAGDGDRSSGTGLDGLHVCSSTEEQAVVAALQPTISAMDTWMRRGLMLPSVSEETWVGFAVSEADASVCRTGSGLSWIASGRSLSTPVPGCLEQVASAALRCGMQVRELFKGHRAAEQRSEEAVRQLQLEIEGSHGLHEAALLRLSPSRKPPAASQVNVTEPLDLASDLPFPEQFADLSTFGMSLVSREMFSDIGQRSGAQFGLEAYLPALGAAVKAQADFVEHHIVSVLLFDADVFRMFRTLRAAALGMDAELHDSVHSRLMSSAETLLGQAARHFVAKRSVEALPLHVAAGTSPLRWAWVPGALADEVSGAMSAFGSSGAARHQLNANIHSIASARMATVLERMEDVLACSERLPFQPAEVQPVPKQVLSDSESVLSHAPALQADRRLPAPEVGDVGGQRRTKAAALRRLVLSSGSTVLGGQSTASGAASVALSAVLGSDVGRRAGSLGSAASVLAGVLAQRRHTRRLPPAGEVAVPAATALRRAGAQGTPSASGVAETSAPVWSVPSLGRCLPWTVSEVDVRRHVLWAAEEHALRGESLKEFCRGDVLPGLFSFHIRPRALLEKHRAQTQPPHPSTAVEDVLALFRGVEVHFTPEWPLSLLFSTKAKAVYRRLHRTLLTLHFCMQVNGRAQQSLRKQKGLHHPPLRRVFIASQSCAHIALALRGFMASRIAGTSARSTGFDADGLELSEVPSIQDIASIAQALDAQPMPVSQLVASPSLLRQFPVVAHTMSGAGSIEAVLLLHEAHLEELARACLVRGVDPTVTAELQAVLDALLKFATWHSLLAALLLEGGGSFSPLARTACATLTTLHEAVLRHLTRLQRKSDAAQGSTSGAPASAGALAGQSEDLADLMCALDSGGFLGRLRRRE